MMFLEFFLRDALERTGCEVAPVIEWIEAGLYVTPEEF